MTSTRRAPAARSRRDTDLAQDLWTQARLWRVELATATAAFAAWAVYGIAPLLAVALLAGVPLAAVHIADGAHRRPGWRRRFGWHPAGWPRALAQRTLSATLRQAGRRLKRSPRWLDELAGLGRALARPYANAAVRRSWWHALNAAGLPQARVRRVTRTAPGARLDLTMPAGCPAGWLHDHSEHIATTFGARAVRVERDPANAARAVAHLTFRDPFDHAPAVWPLVAQICATSVWEPLPLGTDENSQPLTLALLEPGHGAHSTLLGGIPGSGKSTTINLVLAYAALDPACTVFLIDGKPPGLAPWKRCAPYGAGADTKEAQHVLNAAKQWMTAAYDRLEREDRDKAQPGDPTALLVLDELSTFITGQSNKTSDLLADLVKRGRAAGLAICIATQKPEGKAVPTQIRDNVDHRVAHRVKTSAASDTILGQGMAAAGYDATLLPAHPGVGYLDTGGGPVAFRAYWLPPDDVRAIAQRGSVSTNVDTGPCLPTPPSATPQAGEEVLGEREEIPTTPVGRPGESPHSPRIPQPVADNQDEAADSRQVAEIGRATPAPLRVVPEPVAGERRTAKQAMVEAAVLADPELSDRELGRRVGCDNKTVAAARRRLGISR